jgi:hypothetical protein
LAETKEVQDSVVELDGYEIHLIDTPGFDDETETDGDLLGMVAEWANSIYNEKLKISGILYLHDITLGRIRGSGLRNLEMFPKFVGQGKLEFCTLVTTHWGTLKDSAIEIRNEDLLRNDEKYWKPLLKGYHNADTQANMMRFGNTSQSAWEIIAPHLQSRFVPAITEEMVVEDLPLDQTGAGQIVRKHIDQAFREAVESAKRDGQPHEVLALERRHAATVRRMRVKFDEERSQEYKRKSDKLRLQRGVNRTLRWTLRIGTFAAATTTAVLTGGVATGAFAASGVVEVWAQINSKHDQEKKEQLEAEYSARNEAAFKAYQKANDTEEGASVKSKGEIQHGYSNLIAMWSKEMELHDADSDDDSGSCSGNSEKTRVDQN